MYEVGPDPRARLALGGLSVDAALTCRRGYLGEDGRRNTALRSCPPRAGRSLVPGHRVGRAHLRVLGPAEPAVRAGCRPGLPGPQSRAHGGVRDPGTADVARRGGHDRVAPAVGPGADAGGPLRGHRRAPPGAVSYTHLTLPTK